MTNSDYEQRCSMTVAAVVIGSIPLALVALLLAMAMRYLNII